MNYKIKGTIIYIDEITTTNLGVAVQKIHFKQENGRVIFPSALGIKTDMIKDFQQNDEVELEFHISGSKGQYNNVIIDGIVRL